MLIDRDMSKTDLRLQSGISSTSLAKLGKDESVTTNVLVKVCTALDCNIGDIMDISDDCKKAVEDALAAYADFENIYWAPAGSTISCHCGPGTLGVLFAKK